MLIKNSPSSIFLFNENSQLQGILHDSTKLKRMLHHLPYQWGFNKLKEDDFDEQDLDDDEFEEDEFDDEEMEDDIIIFDDEE